MIDFITIYKSDSLDIKIKIYYQTIKVIIKNICNHKLININNKNLFFYLALRTLGLLARIALENIAIEGLLMIYTNKNNW